LTQEKKNKRGPAWGGKKKEGLALAKHCLKGGTIFLGGKKKRLGVPLFGLKRGGDPKRKKGDMAFSREKKKILQGTFSSPLRDKKKKERGGLAASRAGWQRKSAPGDSNKEEKKKVCSKKKKREKKKKKKKKKKKLGNGRQLAQGLYLGKDGVRRGGTVVFLHKKKKGGAVLMIACRRKKKRR